MAVFFVGGKAGLVFEQEALRSVDQSVANTELLLDYEFFDQVEPMQWLLIFQNLVPRLFDLWLHRWDSDGSELQELAEGERTIHDVLGKFFGRIDREERVRQNVPSILSSLLRISLEQFLDQIGDLGAESFRQSDHWVILIKLSEVGNGDIQLQLGMIAKRVLTDQEGKCADAQRPNVDSLVILVGTAVFGDLLVQFWRDEHVGATEAVAAAALAS